MMRIPSASVIITVFLLSSPVKAQPEVIFSEAIPTCQVTYGSRNQKFAHCDGAERNYLTVVVALHGWNGSCGDTFGKAELSMFSVMEDEQFYDWDCFDYASHSLNIDQNVKAFEARIELLSELGYRHIVLVTHSTGGIIALEFLLRRVFDESGTVRQDALERLQGPVVHEAAIWAIPINGLTFNTSLGANLLGFFQNFAGATEQTLPELHPNSPYLVALYGRLLKYRQWYEGLSTDDRALLRIKIGLYHGQDSDWVVRPFAAGPLPDWLGPPKTVDLILTEMPHLGSVNETGRALEPGAPLLHQMPAEVMSRVALTSAPYDPRYGEVFFKEHNPSQSTEDRQNAVLDQLRYFASVQLQESAAPAMRLFALMLMSEFPHYADIDERLVDELIAILRSGVKRSPEFVNAAMSAMTLISGNPLSEEATRIPGEGRASYVQKVLVLLDELRKASREAQGSVNDVPEGVRLQTAIMGAQYQILATTQYDIVRDAAIRSLASEIAIADEQVVKDSDIIAKITSAYYEPRVNFLPGTTKDLLADFFISAAQRKDEVAAFGLKGANTEILVNGEPVPLWQTLDSEELVQSIQDLELNSQINLDPNEFSDLWQRQASDELIRFHTNVIRGVGYNGSDVTGGNTSFDILEGLSAATPSQQEKVVVFSNESPLNVFIGSANEKRFENLTIEWGNAAACC